MNRDYYLALRQRYKPESISLVIVAESPPGSSRYFYDPMGSPTEPLFASFMRQLHLSPSTKEGGLRAFQRIGWLLVDATYEPVNALKGVSRDRVIARDYALLRNDLACITPDRSIPLVLVKANVCRLLAPLLAGDGFNVINRGRTVYFPSTGRQKDFDQQFRLVLNSAGINVVAP